MSKGITCHITWKGKPICTVPHGVWIHNFNRLPQICEHGSISSATKIKKAMQAAWYYTEIKIVRGHCGQFNFPHKGDQ